MQRGGEEFTHTSLYSSCSVGSVLENYNTIDLIKRLGCPANNHQVIYKGRSLQQTLYKQWGQAVKAKKLEGKALKGTSQIRKSRVNQAQLKVNRIPNLIKARYHIL